MLLALLLAAAAPAPPPERISTLVVYGSDACPKAVSSDEILVCARQPESERYRVPKRFRETKPRAGQLSWAGTAESLEWVSRGNLPNSCSAVGSNGQSGCFQKFIRQAREERRLMQDEAARIP